jgi:hypothetical protein
MTEKRVIIYKGVAIQIDIYYYSNLISYVSLSNSNKFIRFENVPINQVINETIHFLDTGRINLDTQVIHLTDNIENREEETKPCRIYE